MVKYILCTKFRSWRADDAAEYQRSIGTTSPSTHQRNNPYRYAMG